MRFDPLSSLVLLPALALANLPFVRSANVCLLMYQMADNDLEYFIRQDLEELSKSELIKTPTLTTWVYFDNRNFRGDWEDIPDPLPFVFNKDGSALTGEKPEGSFYFRQDHELEKLVIEEELGELNSDIPGTIENYLNTALTDCKARGSEEYMIVFSSHGGGFDGFGGDENQRKLTMQTNDKIEGALRSALDANLGEGSKFDVIGFDACLMQAFGAADNYKSVAKYILASEELEPGHGWWYIDAPQSAGGSALDIAKYFQKSFVESKHGGLVHMTPKTLSIVDLNKFETFLVKWEALSKEWVRLMEENDSEVAIMLSRTRSTAYAFEASMDPSIDKNPSVDMYSFMETFQKLCPVGTDTALGQKLQEAMDAYNDMFVANSNGPRTPSGLTGMAVIFPTKKAYAKEPEELNFLLFDDPSYATQAAPEWLNFLSKFYSSGTPAGGGSSVCPSSSTSTVETSSADQLLINPTVSMYTNGSHDIDMEVTRSVTDVIIEYGADFTPLLGEIVARRRLMAMGKREQEGESRSGSRYKRGDRRRMEFYRERRRERRRLEDQTEDGSNGDDFTSPPGEDFTFPPGENFTFPPEEDFTSPPGEDFTSTSPPGEGSADDNFLYVFSGDLLGDYDNSKYSASWDRSFWVIEDANNDIDGIYVYDLGEGLKQAPVIYFPPSSGNIVSQDLETILSTEDAIAFGGEYGFLEFSADNADESGFVSTISLYTFSGDDSSFSEVPLSAGGQVVPVVECYGEIDGLEIYEWIGGFFLTVLDWGSENSIQMSKVDAADTLDFFEVDYYTIDVAAYDEDTGGYDFALFEFDRDGEMTFNMQGSGSGDDFSASPERVAGLGLWLAMSILFTIW